MNQKAVSIAALWVATLCLTFGVVTFSTDPVSAADEDSFTIEKIETFSEQKRIKVHFTDSVVERDLQRHLKTVPPVYLEWWNSSVRENVLTLQGRFEYGTSYLITIADVLLSRSGKRYAKGLNTFLMPDRPSRVEFTDKGTLIERDSRQMVHLDLVNVSEVLFEGVRVPPILLQIARTHLESASDGPARGFFDFCERASKSVREKLAEERDFRPFLGEPAFDSHLFFSPLEKNKKTPFSVPLTFREGKENGNLEYVWFRNNIADGTGQAGPRLLRITDLGITYKRCHSSLLVWVTSLRTGEPIPGVSLLGFDWKSNAYLLGKTNRDGLLFVEDGSTMPRLGIDAGADRVELDRAPLPVSRLSAILAATRDDVSFADLDRKHDLKVGGIAQSATVEIPPEPVRAHLFTERGVYRPGETVHFKGTARRYSEGEILLPSEATCEIQIQDAKGDIVYEQDLAYSPFGTVSADFDVKSYAPLGTYTILLKSPDGEEDLARRIFQVQEFRPPRHYAEVRLKTATRESTSYVNLLQEEPLLKATIGGRYYAGGPVKHGRVRWRVYTAPTEFPQKGYPDFLFGYPADDEDDFVETGESILDETGEIEVTIPLGHSVRSAKHGLRVTATVVDFDGRASTSSKTYCATPPYLVGISKPPATVNFGEPQILRAVVLDASGNAVTSGEVEIRVKERSYIYTRKRNDEGNAFMSWTSVWKDQYTTRLPLENGEARFDFDFNNGGGFLIECSYASEDGTEFTSGSFYSVEGPSYWDTDAQQTFEAIQILPDKSEYQVGEKMRLFVRGARPISSCLLTIERDRLLEHRLVSVDDGEIVLPVTANMRPNVYISLLGVVGRGEFPTYQQEFDTDSPSFVFGTANLKVRDRVDSLTIEIGDAGHKLKALPGDEMTLDLNVTDKTGKGVFSELAVGVVDEQVLALTGYDTPHLKTILDFLLPLSVFTGDARTDLQNQTPYKEILNKPLTGGGGGPLGYAMGIQLRQDFDPVAFFDPSVLTDAGGNASITFRFPDTMTTYRIYAVACDKGSRFGSAQIPALVVKDFYIEPGLPRFLNIGDKFQFAVSAFNSTEQSGPVGFSVTPSSELTLRAESQSYPIDSFDRILIPVEGKAVSAGAASVTAEGRFGGLGDAVKKEIPIQPGHILERDLVFGTTVGSACVTYTFPQSATEHPSHSVEPEDLQALVTLSGSPFLRLKPGLTYLLRYPYGCVEQTSSGILPLASLRALVREGRIPGIDIQEVNKFLETGMERLLGMQTDTGGFSYWPGQRKPNLWGTLYAMTALTFARDAGLEVPDDRMELALDFLLDEIAEGNLNKSQDGFPLACWLLAKAGLLKKETLDELEHSFDSLSRENMLFAVLSAKESSLWTDELLEERTGTALKRRPGMDEEDSYHAVHRESAVALLAGSKILPGTADIDRIAGMLLASMKPEGRWTSTSDTGWALLALGEHFAKSEFSEGPIRGTLSHGGEPRRPFVVENNKSFLIHLDSDEFLRNSVFHLNIENDTTVCYELSLVYPRSDIAKEGLSRGFTIHKTIENTAGTETIHVGDVVKVSLRLDAEPKTSEFLVVDDPLPAGLVAVNSAIATEEPEPGMANASEDVYWGYWDSGGFYRFVPNHLEMRDDRVVAFRDFIWRGKYQYTYYARAVCAGTFRLPPSKVQLMYWPEVCGYTAETEIQIEERQ